MASSNDLSKDGPAEVLEKETELAQISDALIQIAKGEKTAQALESHLTSLEKKIDDLLASFDESERAKVEANNNKPLTSKPVPVRVEESADKAEPGGSSKSDVSEKRA